MTTQQHNVICVVDRSQLTINVNYSGLSYDRLSIQAPFEV